MELRLATRRPGGLSSQARRRLRSSGLRSIGAASRCVVRSGRSRAALSRGDAATAARERHTGGSRFRRPIALDWALDHVQALRRAVVLNSWMWSFADDAAMRRRAALLAGPLGRFLYRRMNVSLKTLMPAAYADRHRLLPEIHRQYLAPFAAADDRARVLWPLAKALNGSAPFYEGLWARRARLRQVPMSIIWGMRDPAFKPSCWSDGRTRSHTRISFDSRRPATGRRKKRRPR